MMVAAMLLGECGSSKATGCSDSFSGPLQPPLARRWRLSVPCSANPRLHLKHLKGFSPV
uniref:Uncharacterized protein n=1 Tax=Anguilla anguilla TaxID=7936 RepID=A0A0E9PIM7_ANGAN